MTDALECVFCKIINHELPAEVLYEDSKVLVILASDWTVKGHTLVIWKHHCRNASDLSSEEFVHFSQVFHKAESLLLAHLEKDRALTLKTGGFVDHFHFHIYPVTTKTTWKEIEDIFNIRVKYQASDEEKNTFINSLRVKFSSL